MKKRNISAFLSALLICSALTSCALEDQHHLPDSGTLSDGTADSADSANGTESELIAPTGLFAVTLIDPEHVVTGMLQSANGTNVGITELHPVIPGTVFTFYTDVRTDAELWMYVNGKFYAYPQKATQNGQPAWKFTLCIGTESATVEFRLQNRYTSIRELLPEAAELTAETVVQITCESGYCGVAPDILPEITAFSAPDDIADALEMLDAPLLPISPEQAQIDGGSYRQYTFHKADGGTFVLRISNGNVRIGEQDYRYDGASLPLPQDGE